MLSSGVGEPVVHVPQRAVCVPKSSESFAVTSLDIVCNLQPHPSGALSFGGFWFSYQESINGFCVAPVWLLSAVTVGTGK